MRRTIALLFALLLTTTPAFAQEVVRSTRHHAGSAELLRQQKTNRGSARAGLEERPKPPETVRVRPTRRPGPSVYDRGAAVSVVGEEHLTETAPRSAAEALRDAPGVFVIEHGHGGGAPVVRGQTGPRLMTMVDGVPLSNAVLPTGPASPLQRLDPLVLDGLWARRGPGPLVYGGGMGGTLSARTLSLQPRDGDGDMRAVYGHTGADGGNLYHARLRYGSSRLRAGGALTYQSLGEFGAGSSSDAPAYEGVEGGAQPFTGGSRWSAVVKGRYDMLYAGSRPSLTLETAYLHASLQDAARTDALGTGRSLRQYEASDHLTYVRMSTYLGAARTWATATLSYHLYEELADTLRLGSADDAASRESGVRDEVTDATLGVRAALSSRLGGLRLSLGANSASDTVESSRQTSQQTEAWVDAPTGAYAEGAAYSRLGLFAHAAYDLVEGSDVDLLVTAGYRYHRGQATADATEGGEPLDLEHSGGDLEAGVSFRLGDATRLGLSWTRTTRLPTLHELGMTGALPAYYHQPNPALRPETAWTYQGQASVRTGPLRLTLAAFYTQLDDPIVLAGPPEQATIGGLRVGQEVNAAEGSLYGAELSAQLGLTGSLTLSGNVSMVRSEVKPTSGEAEPASLVPPVHGGARLRHTTYLGDATHLFVEAYLRAAAAQEDLSTWDEGDPRVPEDGTPAWTTFGARAGLLLADVLRLTLAAENLSDELCRVHGSPVYSAGRHFVLSGELRY